MATTFDRWEKDPFFTAAEEVQESADRMESAYRRWIQETKGAPEAAGPPGSASAELRRDLSTALGTAKWQLEELERAVSRNDDALSAGEDARARHDQFFAAIRSRTTQVEGSLKVSNLEAGEKALAWVRLDEGERDELALFLSAPFQEREKLTISSIGEQQVMGNNVARAGSQSTELRDGKMHGHRRTASASADIGSRKVLIPTEGEDASERSSDDRPAIPMPKISSFSVMAGAFGSKSGMNRNGNGFRKPKGACQHDAEETIPLRNAQLSQDIHACHERSRSCLSACREEIYAKKIYGWLGALRRQLQRSQYQIQYGCSVQMILLAILALLLIFVFVLRSW